MSKFRKGVLFGDEVTDLFNYANDNNFALPAVNVVGTNSVNGVLETAREVNSPVIIQFSNWKTMPGNQWHLIIPLQKTP